MAIAKRPNSNHSDAAEAFIAGAGVEDVSPRGHKVPAMVRFDPDLLRRVDEAARHRGISRSAWIQYTLSRALDNGDG